MTALHDYERLEASGLWRAAPEEQRREVIVSIGDASLVITDINDRALAHWSLPAVMRANPGKRPAIYFPDGDPGETLELDGAEADMIAAIEKLRSAIARQQPRPGRIRLISFLLIAASVVMLAVFWLPDAMRQHTVTVVPPAKRAELGALLLAQTRRLTGPPCTARAANRALRRLQARLGTGPLLVVRNGVRETLSLPGGTILINRALIEDFEDPGVLAGYLLAETLRAQSSDPLDRFLAFSGPLSSFRLLTTGAIGAEAARDFAEAVVASAPAPIPPGDLIAVFDRKGLRPAPYAYARDTTGETTLALIEADSFIAETARPVLSDGAWVALQGICEN